MIPTGFGDCGAVQPMFAYQVFGHVRLEARPDQVFGQVGELAIGKTTLKCNTQLLSKH